MPKVNRKPKAEKAAAPQAEEQHEGNGEATQEAPEQAAPEPKKGKKGPRAKATDPAPKEDTDERPVLYPDYTAAFYAVGYQEPADIGAHEGEMTAARMKELMGWEEQPKDSDDYDFKDAFQTKVKLRNNYRNRPLSKVLYTDWKLAVLKKKWRMNGESIIIGRHGMTISGQHRGIGFILAVQEWSKPTSQVWHRIWGVPGKDGVEPTMPCLVVYGISEDDDTVNTVDTGRPRSGSDAIFRSDLFQGDPANVRKIKARSLEFAARTVWERTGQEDKGYTPHMQHGDMFDFVDTHKRIKDAVEIIYKLNHGEGNKGPVPLHLITTHIGQGVAAGLMFLMGAAKSDFHKYHKRRESKEASQRYCNFDYWDRAKSFWTEFAAASKQYKGDAPKVSPLLPVIAYLWAQRVDGRPADLDKRMAIIIKAWTSWLKHDGEIRGDDLTLQTNVHEGTGVRYLDDYPEIGGIDMAPKTRRDAMLKRLNAQQKKSMAGTVPADEPHDPAFDMPDDAPREDEDGSEEDED